MRLLVLHAMKQSILDHLLVVNVGDVHVGVSRQNDELALVVDARPLPQVNEALHDALELLAAVKVVLPENAGDACGWDRVRGRYKSEFRTWCTCLWHGDVALPQEDKMQHFSRYRLVIGSAEPGLPCKPCHQGWLPTKNA